MRNSKNITDLVTLNPDYIGFIFYGKSKRFVADFPEVTIPKTIKKVGVFVNETIEEIIKKVKEYNLQAVQLHGDESSQYCKALKCQFERSRELQIIKAFAVDKDFDFSKTTAYEKHCDMFLFDTKGTAYGGNGVKYDWNILAYIFAAPPNTQQLTRKNKPYMQIHLLFYFRCNAQNCCTTTHIMP